MGTPIILPMRKPDPRSMGSRISLAQDFAGSRDGEGFPAAGKRYFVDEIARSEMLALVPKCVGGGVPGDWRMT